MSPDLFLTMGLVLALLALPMFLSALSDYRPLRLSIVMACIAAGMLAYAVLTKEGGYSWRDVPEVVINEIAGLLN